VRRAGPFIELAELQERENGQWRTMATVTAALHALERPLGVAATIKDQPALSGLSNRWRLLVACSGVRLSIASIDRDYGFVTLAMKLEG